MTELDVPEHYDPRPEPPDFLDPAEPCDPDHPWPGYCLRSCRWDSGDRRFWYSASWNGQDGEADCNCNHHEVTR